MNSQDAVRTVLEKTVELGSLLTDWEAGFLDSLRKRLAEGVPLSDKQIDMLERIYLEARCR